MLRARAPDNVGASCIRMSSLGRPRQLALAALVVVVVASVVAFIPAVTGGWIYDDHPLIQNNVYVHSFDEWPRWFVTDFWNVSAEITHFGSRILYWRPAVSASYAMDWKLGGGSPVMFHITNTILQAVTSGIVFVTLRRWVGSTLPALAAALLFVVHPTKVESVAWIAGRTDIVCLLAILIASAGFARRLEGRHGGIAMEVGGTLLAYLAKEQAIVLPCFAAVEVWVASGRPAIERSTIVRLVRGALPQLAGAVLYLGVRAIVLPIGASGGAVHMSLGAHARAVLETFGRFFVLGVAPHELSIQQGLIHTVHHEMVYSAPYVVIGALSIVGFALTAWLLRRRAPIVTLGIAVYFATVAPTSNLAFTGMGTLISERFLYLPLIGLALAAAGGLELAARKFGRRVYAVPFVAAIALTAISMGRARDYTDEDAFWAREMAMHPDSPEARKEALAFYTRNHRYYEALAIWQRPQPYDIPIRDRIDLASNVISMMTRLVPDKDTAHLEQLDRFCDRLLAKQPAALALLGVQLTFETPQLAETEAFENACATFLDLRADLQSRLGHDEAAIALASEPLALCPSCSTLMATYALELARAFS